MKKLLFIVAALSLLACGDETSTKNGPSVAPTTPVPPVVTTPAPPTPIGAPPPAPAGVNVQYSKNYVLQQLQQVQGLTAPSVGPIGKELTDQNHLTFVANVDFEVYLLANNLKGAVTLRTFHPDVDPFATGSKVAIPVAHTPPYPFGFSRRYKNYNAGELVGWQIDKRGNSGILVLNFLSSKHTNFYTDPVLNSDGAPHVWVETFPNLGIVLLRFEDVKGDWNDFLIALNIGTENVAAIATKIP
jgi:hypothetical protein